LAKSSLPLEPPISVPNIATMRSLFKKEIMGRLNPTEDLKKSIRENECLTQGKRKEISQGEIDNRWPISNYIQ
jgi:hypothetical protein